MKKTLATAQWEEVWGLLCAQEVIEDDPVRRRMFVKAMPISEFRLGGKYGYSVRLFNLNKALFVGCHSRDMTKDGERAFHRVNVLLKKLVKRKSKC